MLSTDMKRTQNKVQHTARDQEQWVRELDNGKSPEVLRINDMRHNTQRAESDWKPIDD